MLPSTAIIFEDLFGAAVPTCERLPKYLAFERGPRYPSIRASTYRAFERRGIVEEGRARWRGVHEGSCSVSLRLKARGIARGGREEGRSAEQRGRQLWCCSSLFKSRANTPSGAERSPGTAIKIPIRPRSPSSLDRASFVVYSLYRRLSRGISCPRSPRRSLRTRYRFLVS